MQAQTSPRQANNVWSWVIAAAGIALMVLLLLSFMADSRPSPTSEVAGTTSNRIAYLEFGLAADTVRLADPSALDEGETLFTIPHAPEYGALPRLSPDGERFAYTALPAGLSLPGPDSPAELWVAAIEAGVEPSKLAGGVDLLVAPLWTPDGASVVYRRSAEGPHTLALMSVGGGEERILAYSETEALFPVGFGGAGELYYVGLSEAGGSHLYSVELASGVPAQVATLSNGLTRDWSLSPDGARLAFLEVAFSETAIASRAAVLDLDSGVVVPVTSSGDVAFGPVWTNVGELAAGVYNQASGDAEILLIDGESRSSIAGPASGFDVPLAYNAVEDAILVRAFENDSVTAPGRSTLVLVGADGERTTIAEGEVTLVGWTHP